MWNVVQDTYDRELERYGEANIEDSESLFFHDSLAVMEILSLLEGDEGDDIRWQLAIKGVNDLLDSFNFDLLTKKQFIADISVSFAKESGIEDRESRKLLSGKYRNEVAKIGFALSETISESHELFTVWKIFEKRKAAITKYVELIDDRIKEGLTNANRMQLCASYVHMFLNRILRSNQRLQETVIYDLLHQHYKSMIGRKNEKLGKNLIWRIFATEKRPKTPLRSAALICFQIIRL